MRFGYNTNGFAHHHLEDSVTILAELGYQSIALTLDVHAVNPLAADCHVQLKKVHRVLKKRQLHCVIETGARYLLDPWHKHQPTLLSEPEEARHRMNFLYKSIDIASQLEPGIVSFWSGTAPESVPEEIAWQRLVDACRQLSERAEQRDVQLAFEPEPGMLVDTMARFAELHQQVDHPRFGLTMDVGHLHCQQESPIADHIHQWKDWLWNVHIEDMKAGVHDHLMFGEGEMEFPPIFHALCEINYQGGAHVELSRHSHHAVETARQAMAFLQSHAATNQLEVN